MAKMTQARVDRWQKDLEKAAQLVRKTSQDVGSAKLTTSGSVYSNLIDLGSSLTPVLERLDLQASGDLKESATARIRHTVVEAAQRRKEAKAAKDAEKATAS